MRHVTAENVDDIVLGALLFGSGGGGDPYVPRQMLHAAIARYGPVPLVDPAELDPDGLVLPVLGAGAPHALIERFYGADVPAALRSVLERHAGRTCVGVLPVQRGPVNAVLPLVVAAHLGLPCLDADLMHRCFPQLEMTLFARAGIPLSPIIVVDERGSHAVLSAADDATASSLLRGCLPSLGLVALASAYLATAGDCARIAAPRGLSRCAQVGAALRAARPGPAAGYRDVLAECAGEIVFTGVVTDLVQHVTGGFPRGTVSIESADGARSMRIDFQNENLVATEDGTLVVTVPDLINLVDVDTGTVLQSVDVVVGQQVHVLAAPVDPCWHTPEGLAMVGPRAFGFDIDPVAMVPGRRR